MRILNVPVCYLPYVVSPSPLRKKRKSGFLNPTISTMFLGTKTSQMVSLPYYFAIAEDKELLLTPTINYGGGVDASQRVVGIYDQLISGGAIGIKMAADTSTSRIISDGEDTIKKITPKLRGREGPLRCIEAVKGAVDLPFDEGLENERRLFKISHDSDESEALIHSFFSRSSRCIGFYSLSSRLLGRLEMGSITMDSSLAYRLYGICYSRGIGRNFLSINDN